jgi:thymidylate synthase (FAD)
MKIYYDADVYLVAKPHIDNGGVGRFLIDEGMGIACGLGQETKDGDLVPEIAGRVCYMSFMNPRPGGNEAYIKHIKEVAHGSVLEHPSWSFIITGISRSLTHEFVRHRHMSYSQLSQRYVDESDVGFVVPHELREEVKRAWPLWEETGNSGYVDTYGKDPHMTTGLDWITTVNNAREQYIQIVDYFMKKFMSDLTKGRIKAGTEMRKAARGTARSVLPNCTETKIFVTANARAWRHFIEMRGSKHAEVEIRKLAHKVWEVLAKEAINVFGDYVWEMSADGLPLDVATPYRKV